MNLPWDELNVIRTRLEQTAEETTDGEVKKYDREKCLDIIYEFLEYSWTMGVENLNENLSTSITVNDSEMRESINKPIADKTYKERIAEYADQGKLEEMLRVADTDSHRNMVYASYLSAKKAGAKTKTWICTFHNSRDTHMALHMTTVGIDDYFVNYNGNKTLYPGAFGVAEEDCNCQCYLRFA